jgi:hypothetical protein
LIKKDTILEVFGYLKSKQIVSGESEFSEHWLGCSESYMRKLRSSQSEPSLGTIAVCASRLQKAGEQIIASRPHRHVGQQFLSLSERCHQLINEQAVELELV